MICVKWSRKPHFQVDFCDNANLGSFYVIKNDVNQLKNMALDYGALYFSSELKSIKFWQIQLLIIYSFSNDLNPFKATISIWNIHLSEK